MKVSRYLLSDEVIAAKICEMQVKYLDTLYSSNSLSTDWLVDNNQEEYNLAEPEKQVMLINNVEELKSNQIKRLRNAEYYKSQIEYLQSILSMKADEEFEVNTQLKQFIV